MYHIYVDTLSPRIHGLITYLHPAVDKTPRAIARLCDVTNINLKHCLSALSVDTYIFRHIYWLPHFG
jgi:hypothetical protein